MGDSQVSGQTEVNSYQAVAPVRPSSARQPCLLLVEDDESVSAFLKERLETDHYRVDVCLDSSVVELRIKAGNCDLVILDLTLPGFDGIDLLKRIRTAGSLVPVLVLTGRAGLTDRVGALDVGADDYLAKPFEYPELEARVRALLRRASQSEGGVTRFEDLELSRMNRTVTRSNIRIELTPKEFALLEYFMMNPGQRLSRAMIMEHVWKAGFSGATNVVDVYINYLRNKIDRNFERKLIRTVRGSGYQFG